MTDRTFDLLYVCDANDARSPLAEACTSRLVNGSGIGWHVASAGTHAASGGFVKPEVQRAAVSLDLDLSHHRTRSLDADECRAPDLILTMGWDEATHIWSLVPEVWDRVFTIKEFVHWAKQAPPRPQILFSGPADQMRDKVLRAHAVRKRARSDHGFWGGLRPQDFTLAEPHGHADEVWGTLAQAVRALVSDVLTLLAA